GAPQYDAVWAQLVASIAVREPADVQIDLRTLHVLPEALLTIPWSTGSSAGAESSTDQPYRVLSKSAVAARFAINDSYCLRRDGQPAEIIERVMTDPLRTLVAIRRGEIDILDRVFPGDIPSM